MKNITLNREATMTDNEKKEFYDSVPPFMHHFPYVFVWQQR